MTMSSNVVCGQIWYFHTGFEFLRRELINLLIDIQFYEWMETQRPVDVKTFSKNFSSFKEKDV